jgi:hypothetical protein
MHDPFRNPLVVEVEDLLAEGEVFERCRTSLADSQGVLIVADRDALLCSEDRTTSRRGLMQLAAIALAVGSQPAADGGRPLRRLLGWRFPRGCHGRSFGVMDPVKCPLSPRSNVVP